MLTLVTDPWFYAVAIPAVLAYNAFNRVNRVTLAELDGFAHDLLALITTGRRVPDGGGDGLRASAPDAPRPTQRVGS